MNNEKNIKKKDKTVQITMVSGLFSGSFAKLITHPLDTIKAKIQVHTKSFESIRNISSATLKNEGIAGLYKGLPVAVIGSIPASVLYFGTYEFCKKHLLLFKNFSNSEFLMYFIGGMCAETVSCIIYVPVDIIKERMQVQSTLKTYKYSNDLDALFTIIRQEKIRGLYRAYGATVMSFGPLSAFYFMFYEYFKGYFVRNDAKAYLQRIHKENLEELKKHKLDISFSESLVCAALASGLSTVLTNPLDLVKLRMQVQRASGDYKADKAVYRNMFQGLFVILYNEGIRGLFRGCIARTLYNTPTGAISMTMLEFFKPIVKKMVDES
jgi:hypothetical protein